MNSDLAICPAFSEVILSGKHRLRMTQGRMLICMALSLSWWFLHTSSHYIGQFPVGLLSFHCRKMWIENDFGNQTISKPMATIQPPATPCQGQGEHNSRILLMALLKAANDDPKLCILTARLIKRLHVDLASCHDNYLPQGLPDFSNCAEYCYLLGHLWLSQNGYGVIHV